MPRPPKREVKIEMTPFLDSLVIMMSLICLVLITVMMPIVENPQQFRALTFDSLFSTYQRKKRPEAKPVYIDCRPDGAMIIPGGEWVSLDELRQPGNPIERLFARVAGSDGKEYIILMARPGALPVYRHLKKEILRRDLVCGADVLDANAVLDWRQALRELRILSTEY